jgi:hypothetical protein
VPVDVVDMGLCTAPWSVVVSRTASVARLRDDPHFATLASGSLGDLFDSLPVVSRPVDGIVLVVGPGAALVDHDVLWYADLPKRYAESAVAAGRGQNLGQPASPGDVTAGPASLRRLFYIDWPLLDRHRDSPASRVDGWIDMQDLVIFPPVARTPSVWGQAVEPGGR